jgi:hypothetical protein
MGWDDAIKAAQGGGGGSRFLKLASGEKAEIVFLDEPHSWRTTWPDGGTSTRFAFNVWNVGTCELQICEMSTTVFRLVVEARDTYEQHHGGLDKIVFVLKRTGTGKETKYSLLFLRACSQDESKKIAAAEPYMLSDYCMDNNPAATPAPPGGSKGGSWNGQKVGDADAIPF